MKLRLGENKINDAGAWALGTGLTYALNDFCYESLVSLGVVAVVDLVIVDEVQLLQLSHLKDLICFVILEISVCQYTFLWRHLIFRLDISSLRM